MSGRTAARSARLAALAALFGLASCGSCSDRAPADAPKKPSEPVRGTLEGVVRLASGSIPAYTQDQMEKKVLTQAERADPPTGCSPPKPSDRTPVTLTEDGALSGMVVAASDFARAPEPRAARRFEVAIEDCRLTPRLIVAQLGDTLRVQNHMNFPFMPAYGRAESLRTLLPGQNYDVPLDKTGGFSVSCGFTAPCGRTDVIVLSHSFATTTDDKGHFRFESFPADEPISVSVWHPLFLEASQQVAIGRGENKKLEILVTPRSDQIPKAP